MQQKKNSNSLPLQYNKYIPKGDKKTLEEYFNHETTKQIRKLLSKVLEDRIETAIKSSENKGKYEIPNWSEYQADSIGYRRGLREILKLL